MKNPVLLFFFSSNSDWSKLAAHDVVANCRTAFDAAEKLGIPRVIEPRDMSLLAVPDKLAVMTYLYQLRAHFTGHQLQIEQLGNTTDESSYVIGNYKTDNLATMKLDHIKMHLQNHQQSYISMLDEDGSEPKSPTEKKDVKNLILSGSKHLLGKVLSPTKDRPSLPPPVGQLNNATSTTVTGGREKPLLMTRRELTDPFGSDDEDEQLQIVSSGSGGEADGVVDQLSPPSTNSTSPKELGTPSLDPATTNVNIIDLFFFVLIFDLCFQSYLAAHLYIIHNYHSQFACVFFSFVFFLFDLFLLLLLLLL